MPGAAHHADAACAAAVAAERLRQVVFGGVVVERHRLTFGDVAQGDHLAATDDRRRLATVIEVAPEVVAHEVELVAGALLIEVQRGSDLKRIPRGHRRLAPRDREDGHTLGDRVDGDQPPARARD